jgi:hypothetical protein
MPDISMCTGKECPKKQMCYRHTAKASDYQSFFMNPPIKKDGTCDYFWDNEGYNNNKEQYDAILES